MGFWQQRLCELGVVVLACGGCATTDEDGKSSSLSSNRNYLLVTYQLAEVSPGALEAGCNLRLVDEKDELMASLQLVGQSGYEVVMMTPGKVWMDKNAINCGGKSRRSRNRKGYVAEVRAGTVSIGKHIHLDILHDRLEVRLSRRHPKMLSTEVKQLMRESKDVAFIDGISGEDIILEEAK